MCQAPLGVCVLDQFRHVERLRRRRGRTDDLHRVVRNVCHVEDAGAPHRAVGLDLILDGIRGLGPCKRGAGEERHGAIVLRLVISLQIDDDLDAGAGLGDE